MSTGRALYSEVKVWMWSGAGKMGPCTETPMNGQTHRQTDRHEWKHYFPATCVGEVAEHWDQSWTHLNMSRVRRSRAGTLCGGDGARVLYREPQTHTHTHHWKHYPPAPLLVVGNIQQKAVYWDVKIPVKVSASILSVLARVLSIKQLYLPVRY